MRNIYITSIIWSRNYSPSRAPDLLIVVFYNYFPTDPDPPRFWIGFVLLTLQYYVLCFKTTVSLSPLFLVVIVLSVIPRFAPSDNRFWSLQTVLISPPIYNNIVILLCTNMAYVKRQYDIKQSIGKGIQIELPSPRSSPPAVTSHE
jgi:hypothetical protein